MHEDIVRPPARPVRDWRPQLPAGRIETIVLHWTAGDYASVSPSYHFCVTGPPQPLVYATCDLLANMRDVRWGDEPYAAHVAGRNSFAAGIAACAMLDAQPDAFGRFPLAPVQVDALCRVAAVVARTYAVPLERIVTHAELAYHDGYFGSGGDDVRWDLARLEPSPAPLTALDAQTAGDALRARIAAL